jgi:hypothetical protein
LAGNQKAQGLNGLRKNSSGHDFIRAVKNGADESFRACVRTAGSELSPTGAAQSLPHRQQMLGAPFKPSVGLSGIMAVEVPLAVPPRSAVGNSILIKRRARLRPCQTDLAANGCFECLRENSTDELSSEETGETGSLPRNLLFPLGARVEREVAHQQPLSHSSQHRA